jgi:1,2-diacylglycerol 3-alpha-glucosyltransferase
MSPRKKDDGATRARYHTIVRSVKSLGGRRALLKFLQASIFLRIGFFTECYRPVVNGVVSAIVAMREGLRAAGHEVVCITPTVPSYEDVETAIVRLPSCPLPSSSGYRLTLPAATRSIDGRLERPLDVVHAHSQFITGGMALRYARDHAVPLVFTYHTRLDFYAHYVPFERNLVRRGLAAWTRAYANSANAVVAPTAEVRRYLTALGVTAPIEIVPSPVDLERFASGRRRQDLRAAMGAGSRETLALCVGRLAREKNLELAFAVCAAAGPRIRLALAGEGPLRRRLERLARELGIAERVRFLGPVAPAAMPDYYASADALLFPSVSETQGLVLVEALAAGLRIVAVDTPQTREVVGDAADLVAPQPAAMARALEAAGPRTPEQSAIQLASHRFTIEEQARKLVALYASVQGGFPT